ncbi:LysR family transcriptional regulator [Brevibacterium sandarakinum]|nr:LysR substrate-binding domain-containing protein [Brevibacterium sandarakinum]
MLDRRLHVLRLVDECGTVTAAAAALYLTPSAVSQQIRALADTVGLELLEPHRRSVRLTPAGRAVLRHADRLHEYWELAQADLAGYGQEAVGVLRMAGFPTAVAALVAPAAARLRRLTPGIQVEVSEADTADAFGLLLAEVVDIAVTVATPQMAAVGNHKFDQQPLMDDPLDLLLPADHRLAGAGIASLHELADEIWITPDPRQSHHHDLVLHACTAAGFRPHTVHRAKEWIGVAALVAHGFGVSLIPRLGFLLPPDYPVVRLPVRDAPTRQVLTCVRRGSREHPVVATGLNALCTAAGTD